MKLQDFLIIAATLIVLGGGAYLFQSRSESAPVDEGTDISQLTDETMLEQPQVKQDIQRITETVRVTLKTNKGDIVLDLEGARAPMTVGNFVTLAEEGVYNGIAFHRVIPDFMIQAGDPNSKDQADRTTHGTGGPGYVFADEINAESYGLQDKKLSDLVPAEQLAQLPAQFQDASLQDFYEAQGYVYTTEVESLPLERGVIAMANAGPNTNGSQFFIIVAESVEYLQGKHTPFGRVVEGMDVADAIVAVPTDENDNPTDPVIIESVEVSR